MEAHSGHQCPAGTHAPVWRQGTPQGQSCRATWPPCQDTAPKRKGGPATCGPHLQRDPSVARRLGIQDRSASSQRGTPHLRARTPAPASCPLDLRQGSSGTEERAAQTLTHPPWFTVHSHRTPEPPQPTAAAAFRAHGCYREGPSEPAGAFLMDTSRGSPRAGARFPGRCSPGASAVLGGSGFFPAVSHVFSPAQPPLMDPR